MGKHHIDLTSAEISCLWSSYLADSMSVCIFKYLIQHIKDNEIKKVAQHSLDLSQQHVEIIKGIFEEEEIVVPEGFTDKDVNLKARQLFSDSLCLHYLKSMSKGGLAVYAAVLPTIYREDIRAFYSKCFTSAIELENEVTDVLLEKGLAVRPPQIPKPKKVEFVHKQSFLLEAVGKHRTLTGQEVTNLYANIQTNSIGIALSMAFAQVATTKKIQEYMIRGKEISKKHIEVFSTYLKYNDLPVPTSHDHEITDETESPFSEKLMMFHFSVIAHAGIGNYGVSISESQRSDLVADYSRLLLESIAYSEDGANIMIDKGWLEQPPMAADRKKLMKDK